MSQSKLKSKKKSKKDTQDEISNNIEIWQDVCNNKIKCDIYNYKKKEDNYDNI